MISIQLIQKLLSNSGIGYNKTSLEKFYIELSSMESMSPFDLLQYLFKKLEINDVIISHSSSTQIKDTFVSGAIFIDDKWNFISSEDSEYHIFDLDTGTQSVIQREDIPVTVVMWLESRDASGLNKLNIKSIRTKSFVLNTLKDNPKWLINIAIATVIINLFAVVSSLFAMQVYDRVVPTLAMETLTSLVIGVMIIYSVDWLLKITRAKILDHNSSYIDKQLSDVIYKRLMNIRLDKIPQQVGTLSAQINGLESVRQFFSSTIVFTLVDMPFALLFLFVIYTIGGPISLVYLLFFVISIIIALIAQKRSKNLAENLVMRSNEKVGVLIDSIKGRETIRSFGAHGTFEHEWNQINDSVSDYSLKQKRISNKATTSSQTLGQFSYVAAIVIGVYMIGEGSMTMGGMIACSILGGRVLGPVGQAVSHLVQYESVAQSIKMIDAFWDIPEQRSPGVKYVYPDTRPTDILLEKLQFAYTEESRNIIDIDFLHIQKGEKIALLGSIGSGKSTLLKVLAGLYKPSSGRIRLGSADLWELEPDYIAKNIGYLPQSPELFKGTLKSNLTLGRPIGDNKILSVASLLNLQSITQQSEKGLELEISEGGSGLSGGQKQLVALSRLFVGSSSVWILDEPSSSLDPQTENMVINSIKKQLRPEDILIFATHNPRIAMKLSTRVIVMNNGTISNDSPTESVVFKKREVS